MSLERNPNAGIVVELFGPTVEFLTSPDDEHNDFCTLKGMIPPGVSVPLHSHPDAEDFFVISGTLEGLKHDADGYRWVEASAGDYIHVPGDARHAWRNLSEEPVVNLIITTKRMGHFFREAGRPAAGAPQPVTPEAIARFAAIAAEYGHWSATAEENESVGIRLSF